MIGDDGGYVSLAAYITEEDAEVSGAVACSVGSDHEADYTDYRLEYDDGCADSPFIGKPGEDHAAYHGGNDGRGGK